MRLLEISVFNLVHRDLSEGDHLEANRLLGQLYVDAIPRVREAASTRANCSGSMVFLVALGMDHISRGLLPICEQHWPPFDYCGLWSMPAKDIAEALAGHRKISAHLKARETDCIMIAWAGFLGVAPIPPADFIVGKARVTTMPAPPPGAPS
jgi:hypothetical protein